jgi:hypothetical protein
MNNTNDQRRFFQWVAGENRGQVKVFDRIENDGENVYIIFKDKSRINENLVGELNEKNLTGKLMAEIDDPKNTWQFKEEWVGREEERWEQNAQGEKVCVQPFVPGKKVIKLIPPKPTPKQTSRFGKVENAQPSVSAEQPKHDLESQKSNIDKSDPVCILMSKAKKVEMDINMEMSVSLPSKSLYDIAKESFDYGNEKFVNYIVDEITVDEIKDALKSAIKNMYEEGLLTDKDFKVNSPLPKYDNPPPIPPLKEGSTKSNRKEVNSSRPNIEPESQTQKKGAPPPPMKKQ